MAEPTNRNAESDKPIPDSKPDNKPDNICHSASDEYDFSVEEEFESTYKIYPGKKARAEEMKTYILWLINGRDIKGRPKKLKFNHIQIDVAVRRFAADNAGTDKTYIKHFATFLNGKIIDCIDETREEYEQTMLDEFGEKWRDIKFKYTLGGKEL